MSEEVLRALRMQAWERAKAELRGVGATFFGTLGANPGQADQYDEAVDKFIQHVENHGLQE